MIQSNSILQSAEHLGEDDQLIYIEQFITDLALLQHQQRKAAPPGNSLEFCQECGNEIPLARRRSMPGCTLCIECKTVEEQQEKRYG